MRVPVLTVISSLALFVPSLAHGDIMIGYRIDGGSIIICDQNTNNTGVQCPPFLTPPSFVDEGLLFTDLAATSNSPGDGLSPASLVTKLMIQNTTAITQILEMTISAQNFTVPTTPPSLSLVSHVSGSVVTGAASLTFTTCADPNNDLLGLAQTTSCGVTPYIVTNTPTLGLGPFSDTQSITMSSLTAPYSLGQELVLVLGAGASIDLSSTLGSSVSAVPEPSSLALLFTTALGAAFILRRRLPALQGKTRN